MNEKVSVETYQNVPLGSLCQIIIGRTPKRENLDSFGGDNVWVTIADMKRKYIVDSKEKLTEKGIAEANARLIPEETLLLSFKLSLGKVAITKKPLYTNEAIAALIPKKKFNVDYLYYYLKQSNFSNLGRKAVKGLCLNKEILSKIMVRLPSLETQNNIAVLLEKTELVQQWRNETTELLTDYINSTFSKMFGDPITNSKKWETRKLKQLYVTVFGGGTPSKSNPDYYIGNIPWVTPKDMKETFISDSIDHISERAIEESSTNLVPPHSLLMVIRSGILKKKLPVAINLREVTINQDMKAFVFSTEIANPIFMLYFFLNYQPKLLNRVRSVTADNLEFGVIKNIDVILPPIALQNEFAEVVKGVMKLEGMQMQSGNYIESLNGALTQKLLRGNLKC